MKYEIINLISTHYSLILIKGVLHISNLVLFELFSCYCHIFTTYERNCAILMINKQSNENKIKPKKSNYMKNEYDNSLADKSNSIHSYRIHMQ